MKISMQPIVGANCVRPNLLITNIVINGRPQVAPTVEFIEVLIKSLLPREKVPNEMRRMRGRIAIMQIKQARITNTSSVNFVATFSSRRRRIFKLLRFLYHKFPFCHCVTFPPLSGGISSRGRQSSLRER